MHNSSVNKLLPVSFISSDWHRRRYRFLVMIRKIVVVVSFVVLAVGCSKSSKMQRGQQQYQTVQEGSASGVTSTINGPGETPAPVTDTNIDTTTNFTLPTNPHPLGNSTAGTSVAGTIPSATTYPATSPVRRQPRTDTQGMVSAPAPIITDTIGRPTPPMPKLRTTPQPETDTTTTSTTDPNTTTAAQTTTSSASEPPPPTPKKSKPQDQEQPPPPPPPTTTDTIGTRG